MSKGTKTLFNIVGIILVVLALAMEIHNISDHNGIIQVIDEVNVIALIAALVYSLYGYKKDSAKYYKLFVCLFAVMELLRLVLHVTAKLPVYAVLTAVIFGALCILLVAQDLGRTKSLVLTWIVLLANLVPAIIVMITNFRLSRFFAYIASIALSIVLLFMVLGKYEDKAERGTK